MWRDPWIPDLPSLWDNIVSSQVIAVALLMNHGKLDWDVEKLKMHFDDDTILAIKNIPRWVREQEDSWVWLKSTSRIFQ